MGYTSDTRLAIYLTEHWRQTITAGTSWRSPAMFAPIEGSLGFTDSYALHALPYLPLRAIGLEPTVAFGLGNMAVAAVAMLSAHHLARSWLHLRPITASALACIAVLPNALFTQAGHTQLFVIHWLPIIAVVARFGLTRPGTAWWYGAIFASGLLSGLVALSGFYIAWFAALAVALFSAAIAVMERRSISAAWRRTNHRRVAASCGALLAGLAGPLWMLLAIYLPVVESGRSRSAADTVMFEMGLRHTLNVGPDNVVWGWLHRDEVPGLLGREWMLGFPPGFILAVAGVALLACVRRRQGASGPTSSVPLASAATVGALILIPLRIGGWTPWTAIAAVVPGGMAIRAPGRIWMVAALIGTVCIAAGASLLRWRAESTPASRRLKISCLLLAGFLLIEQVNTDSSKRVSVSTERTLAAVAERTPVSCRSFFATGSSSDGTPWGVHLDAMVVSMFNGLPTLNGYSGFEPDEYPSLPGTLGHPAAMRQWAARHGIADGLCQLDLGGPEWTTP